MRALQSDGGSDTERDRKGRDPHDLCDAFPRDHKEGKCSKGC